MSYMKRNLIVKLQQKISKSLVCHDSIIRAITTRGCKEVLTVEQGQYMYWVRLYRNGKCDCLKDSKYFENSIEGFNQALKYWEEQIEENKKNKINLLFNKL